MRAVFFFAPPAAVAAGGGVAFLARGVFGRAEAARRGAASAAPAVSTAAFFGRFFFGTGAFSVYVHQVIAALGPSCFKERTSFRATRIINPLIEIKRLVDMAKG